MFFVFGRSVGSVTMETVRLTRVDNNTQDGTESIHGWCAMLFSVSWLDTVTSLVEYALSLCGVTSRDTRRASRISFPRPYHNQHVELRLCRQRVKQQHKEKLGLEQHFRATDFLP